MKDLVFHENRVRVWQVADSADFCRPHSFEGVANGAFDSAAGW